MNSYGLVIVGGALLTALAYGMLSSIASDLGWRAAIGILVKSTGITCLAIIAIAAIVFGILGVQ